MEPLQKPWEIDLTLYGTEQELLEGLRRRDRMACTCLLKQHAPRLYRMAVQVTGHTQDAEDVLQEAFMQACSRIDTFQAQGGSSLGTWLYRIVLNSALMHLRKSKAAATLPIGEQGEPEGTTSPSDLADPERSPGEQMLSKELRETLENAILQLPNSLRAAFVLRDVEGLSTVEAAAMLGIGESALKVRLHRARIALRESLTPYLNSTEVEEIAGAEDNHSHGRPGGNL